MDALTLHCTCEKRIQKAKYTHANSRLLEAVGPVSDRLWVDQSSDFECTVKGKNRKNRGSQGRVDRETKH